ncbi:MAG: hypothetical protein WCH35_08170 [Comamonadaceae bacterium]
MRWGFLATGFALLSAGASAQTIESLQWLDRTQQQVVRITFNANVRFLQQAPLISTDLAQLSFQIIAADEAVLGQTVEEGKRLEPLAGKPGIALSYVPAPKVPTKSLTLRFTDKVRVLARQGPGARSIDIAFGGEDAVNSTLPAASALPLSAVKAEERRYAVLLQTFPVDDPAGIPRVPAEFQDYAVFTQPLEQDGRKQFALAIGYFRTEEDAKAVRQRAADRFPTSRVLQLEMAAASPSVDSAAAAASTPKPPAAEDSAVIAVLPDAESLAKVTSKAAELMDTGRAALAQQRLQEAVEAFNQVLMLPPNPSSQQAQELIGAAWEALKQPDKARIEYQLYLKLYPQGEGAPRVAQRLSALGSAATATAQSTDQVGGKSGAGGFSSTGSISQYYYGGRSKTDSLVNISAGIDQNTLSRTNQSALVTSVDVSGRYRTEDSETKVVLRDTYSKNFLSSSNAQSGLSAAYVDYRDSKSKLDLRVGRQSAIGGSLFGLFDGVSLAMPFGSKYKLDAMVGVPANTLVSAPSQRLAGVMLEADNLFEHWGGNISLVDQTTEGISDRRATGLELRYFGESVSLYSQIDYDLNFHVINAASLQGSIQGPLATTITVLLDSRKAPSLQLSDALISSGETSLQTLLQSMSLAEVKSRALGTAAQARQALFSVSRALAPKWQGSLDLRYSDIGALPAVPGTNFEATAATGAQFNIALQLTGSNLYSSRDINGFNLSVLHSDTLRGTQLAYNNLTGFYDNKASFEPSIRLYSQTDNTATKVLRVSPGVRLSYKISDRASVLGETIYERSTTDGPTNHEESSAVFFYVGYRYDFF